jgi:tetratricopeptide (TPR) repeat protein
LASGSLTDAQEAAFWEALGELVRLRRPAESRDAAQRAADRFAHCGDAYGESYAVWLLAAAELRVNGAIERSTQARMEAALAAARRSGDRHLIAGLLRHLARTNSESGRAEKARAALREAAEIVDPTDTVLLTAVMGSSADEELRHGNVDAAIALWNQAASLAEESRLSYAALCFANIAMSEAMRGNLALARLMLMRGLNGVRTARHAFGMARPFDYFAQLLKESGDLPRAARLAGFGAAFFDGEPQRPPADQRRFDDMIAELRRTLGAEAFEREWNQGRALEVDGAVAQLMMG